PQNDGNALARAAQRVPGVLLGYRVRHQTIEGHRALFAFGELVRVRSCWREQDGVLRLLRDRQECIEAWTGSLSQGQTLSRTGRSSSRTPPHADRGGTLAVNLSLPR